MRKQLRLQQLVICLSTMGIIGFSSHATASAFQLWEQDGASIGNYHAGRAAEVPDASIAYYNPAGLIKIHNQEIVFGLDPVLTNFKFRGTVNLISSGIGSTGPQAVSAQSGNFNLIPNFNYAAPLSERVVFGLSVVSPFGFNTSYGNGTATRYVTTLASLKVTDIAPSLGITLNDKLSVGFGVDIERARGEQDLIVGNPTSIALNTSSNNVGYSWGYGYYLGALYQFTEQTRVGLSFHSKVTHHLNGTSKLVGPLANNSTGGLQRSTYLKNDLTLPASTTFSLFHTLNPTWDVMGTIVYTQWDEFMQSIWQNVAAISHGVSNNSVLMIIPEHYGNTLTYSIGANYHANEQWIVRGGVGYDQTPTIAQYRNLQLPDSNRIAAALGTHYQASETLGFDAGWTHYFVMNTKINNLSQSYGDQTTVTNGSVHTSSDVFGLQVKWDIT